jgi:preprotein translocase subunit SecG
MTILLTILHVLACLFLIIVVLLQSGKAADLAGAFGGMGSQTAFGPRGAATVLTKATQIAAALFMLTSLSLSVLSTRAGRTGGGGSTVLEQTATPATKKSAPAQQQQQTTPQPGAPPIQVQTPGGGTTITVPPQPAPAQQAPAKK